MIEIKAKAVLAIPNTANLNVLPNRLFKDVVNEFIEWSQTEHLDWKHNAWRATKHLLPYLGNKYVGQISTGDIEYLKHTLCENGLENKTVNKIIYLLSSIFEYFRESNSDILNPVRGKVSKLRETTKPIQVFSEKGIDGILRNAYTSNKSHYVAIALGIFAGLWCSEILGLQWQHVDLVNKKMFICHTAVDGIVRDTTKSGKSRIVPVGGRLYNILVEHSSERNNCEYVVHRKDNERYRKMSFFTRIRDKSGVDNKAGIHALRHTFATRAVKQGVDIPTLQRWLGHSTIEMTMRYVHIDEAHSRHMMTLMDAARPM